MAAVDHDPVGRIDATSRREGALGCGSEMDVSKITEVDEE